MLDKYADIQCSNIASVALHNLLVMLFTYSLAPIPNWPWMNAHLLEMMQSYVGAETWHRRKMWFLD